MSDMTENAAMPAEIDFSDSLPNPYAGRTRRRVTINIDSDTIEGTTAAILKALEA